MAAAASTAFKNRYIDIGANLTDERFLGVYHGRRKHESDFDEVLGRSWDAGLERIIVTAGCLEEAKAAAKLVKADERLSFTVGVHPTRAGEFDTVLESPEAYMDALREVISGAGKAVRAIGECGLDADRTRFCSLETQIKHFPRHFELAEETGLPLFLHSRACHGPFLDAVLKGRDRLRDGVVHSFTGSAEEARALVDAGLFIGINGCSLKTEENLDVVRSVPLASMMLETDAPWCGVKRTHAGFGNVTTAFDTAKKPERRGAGQCVKDRTEPCHIVQVAEIVAALHGVEVAEVAEVTTGNSNRVFFADE